VPPLYLEDEIAVVLVHYQPACPATINMAVAYSFHTRIHGFHSFMASVWLGGYGECFARVPCGNSRVFEARQAASSNGFHVGEG
jgi:hypothetical protein